MRFLLFLFALLPIQAFSQCDMEIAGFDPVTLDISIVVHDGYCGSSMDSIGEFLLTLTFDPTIPDEENPFSCFNPDGTTDLLFPLDFPFVDIGQGVDNIIQGGDTLTFNLIESQPLGLGTTLCWQEAIASGAFDSCIVLYITQINDSACLDGGCEGLGGFDYPDDNTEDNTITFSLTDACGGLPPPPLNYGCTDPLALNFDVNAEVDDGSCIDVVEGCTDEGALNYNSEANVDDGSCIDVVEGCTDEEALNYNSEANVDDGSCIDVVEGCTDEEALNYNSEANVDDGSCEFDEEEEEVTPECTNPKIFVPNAFTPNNDGTNDYFQIQTIAQCFIDWETKIYNRWGQVVWSAESPDDKWYGESFGKLHYNPDGAYIYTIDAVGKLPSATQRVQGHVTIFR